MTSALLVSRRRKLDLHKLSIVNPAIYLAPYKTYRNIFNSTLRASKIHYYDSKFRQYAKNPKKTWDTLNELTSKTPKNRSAKITSIITPDKTITDPTDIANEFNEFFTKAGKQISNSVPPTSATLKRSSRLLRPPRLNLAILVLYIFLI